MDKATGKGQMVTFLSNAWKAKELNIKVRQTSHYNDNLSIIFHNRPSCGTGGTTISSVTSLRAIRAEAPIWKLNYTDDTRSKWLHHNRPIISDTYQHDNMNNRIVRAM